MNRILLVILIFVTSFVAFNVFAYQLENPNEVERISQVAMLGPVDDMSNIKVCVLDEGTAGYNIIKDRLGKNIKLLGEETTNGNFHGLGMAQELLAASGATRLPENKQPEILIVPAEGYTELKKAVETCIENKVDIILHSINWEWSSNFEGDGFVNQLVRQATKSGILWVNSAGNNSGLTYHSNLKIADENEGLVSLPDDQNTLRFSNQVDSNIVTITMSWNDFDGIDYATQKDLDFVLYSIAKDSDQNEFVEMQLAIEENGQVKEHQKFGQKKQIGRHRSSKDPENVTGNALETAEMQLDKGEYALQVFYKSRSIEIKDSDQFRIILRSQKPESIKMQSAKREMEITPPADNPRVIAVGLKDAPFSALGPTPNGTVKPDLVFDLGPQSLTLKFSDGTTKGPDTSDAAAIFAGIAVALKARDSSIGVNEIHGYLDYLSGLQNPDSQKNRGPVWQTPTHIGMMSHKAENQSSLRNDPRAQRPQRYNERPYDNFQGPNTQNRAYPSNQNNKGTPRYYPQTPRMQNQPQGRSYPAQNPVYQR